MNGISELFRALGPGRLTAIAVVGLGLIGFFLFISMRLATPDMAMLYNDLDVTDSAAIVNKLEAANVPYTLGNNGKTILVPADKVLKLRMTMASEGIPTGGSVGYEIFDRNDQLGTSSFVQSINHVRALEGELARTIRSLDRVEGARVHLVLPERQLFSRETRQPSASIALKTAGTLGRGQIIAIQNLVAAAVSGLDPHSISIVDQKGRLLAKGENEDGATAYATSLEEKQVEYEQRMRDEVESLLEKSIGLGKVRAEISAQLDLNRVTTNSEIYDPDGQVVRSTVTVSDKNQDVENAKNDSVSIANNLPENDAGNNKPDVRSTSSGARTEETTNYEISKTVKTQVHEAGTVKRLSVAVLVDGHYKEAKDGTVTYEPRSEAELDKLTKLVKSAVGYDQARGDHVEVINMKFAEIAGGGSIPDPVEINLYGFKKEDLFRMAELGILGIVGVLVILLVLRPLVIRLVTIPEGMKPALQAAGAGPQATAALTGPNYAPDYANIPRLPNETGEIEIPRDETGQPLTARQIAEKPGGLESAIDIAAVEGKVQTSAVKKVGQLVERHPDESTAVVRSWLFNK